MASKQESKGKQSSAPKDEEKQEVANKADNAAHKTEERHSKSEAKSAQDDSHEEIDEKQEIDTLIDALDEDLTSVDMDLASGAIDEWQAELKGSEDAELKEIANDLKQLKKLLTSGKSKGPDIGEVLTRLGEQTTKAAENAERGYKTRLQKLGKFLTKAGTSLAE